MEERNLIDKKAAYTYRRNRHSNQPIFLLYCVRNAELAVINKRQESKGDHAKNRDHAYNRPSDANISLVVIPHNNSCDMNSIYNFLKSANSILGLSRSRRSFRSSWLVLVGAIATALFVGYNTTEIYLRERSINNEAKAVEERIVKIKEENEKLKDELKKINSPEGIEKIARGELNLQKAGEFVAVIVSASSAETVSPLKAKPQIFDRLRMFLSKFFDF